MTDRIDTAKEREKLAELKGHTTWLWRSQSEDWGAHWVVFRADNVLDEISESVDRGEDAALITAAPDLIATVAKLCDALDARDEKIERLRATLSAITATDCYSRDECTAMARAALKQEGGT